MYFASNLWSFYNSNTKKKRWRPSIKYDERVRRLSYMMYHICLSGLEKKEER